MDLCKFSNLFGEPNTGAHSLRIFSYDQFNGIAFVDLFLTVLVSYIVSYFSGINFFIIFICLFVLGIFLHLLFCVDTGFLKLFRK